MTPRTLHPSLTLDRLEAAARESMGSGSSVGFCIACGAQRDQTEPDAEAYLCDECETPTVYGAERLFVEAVTVWSANGDDAGEGRA